MNWTFSPEADIDIELLDRCIDRHYTVQIQMTWGSHEHRPEPFDAKIIERFDGTMQLVVRNWSEADNPVHEILGPKHTLFFDNIDTIHIY